MSRSFSYINSAKTAISQYRGDIPLAAFLKSFFSKDKKYGSRDRRTIAALCYAYYRVALAMPGSEIEDKILAGLFLTSNTHNAVLHDVKPELSEQISLDLTSKLNHLGLQAFHLFPYIDELSPAIDHEAFAASFSIQPKLFIRLRPQTIKTAEAKLTQSGLAFEKTGAYSYAFDNGTRLDDVLILNKEYVVQDINSQHTFSVVPEFVKTTPNLNVWDCCAASGGKSIMVWDTFRDVNLTVSDVRHSILKNLVSRFAVAGIKNYHHFEADLTVPAAVETRFGNRPFDLVICDAPCTGSGTWSRTPEQLAFFRHEQIGEYSQLQKKIAANASKAIRKGGYLLYITCSVFEKENEDVVTFLKEEVKMDLVEKRSFVGYDKQADTLFAALLRSTI